MKLLIILLLIKLIFPELKLTFESDEIKLTQENKKDFELLVKNEIYKNNLILEIQIKK